MNLVQRPTSPGSKILAAILTFTVAGLLETPNRLLAESVAAHHREGASRGFFVLSSLEGKTLAAGDTIQAVHDNQVTSELVLHFRDGSVHDETTVFSQDHAFRLISDHLIEKGPSFPKPIDIFIDAIHNQVTVHANENGKEKDSTEHMDLPEDLANGLILTLLRNISPSVPETKVSLLATSAKPQLVKIAITAKGERTFSIAGSLRKATDFDVKVEIGGVKGAMAPLVGKQPPDTHIWMSAGTIPTFVRSEGPFFEGGPIWRTDVASIRVSSHDLDPGTIPPRSPTQ